MPLLGGLLDFPHVFVGKPKMMADFMYKDMSDDGAERLLVLRPEVKDRAAVEPDHVGKLSGHRARRGLGSAAAAKQPQKVEFAFAVHCIERFIVGKILDPDHNASQRRWNSSGRVGECRFGDRRRQDAVPAAFWAAHGAPVPRARRSRLRSRT